jgi:Plasmid replication region DNA-binding N-term
MAHSHGITRDDVFAAANSIFAQGKNPTQAAVRSVLGQGSFATISKYLQEWRQERQEDGSTTLEQESIPEEDNEALRRFYWALRGRVELGITSEQVELLERENQKLREKQASYDAIAAELAGMRFAYQQTLERLDQLTRENERLTQELAKSKARKPRATKQTQATCRQRLHVKGLPEGTRRRSALDLEMPAIQSLVKEDGEDTWDERYLTRA